MSTILPPKLMTAAEFEALPDDGMERDLVRGQITRERPLTKRNRFHARTESRVAHLLWKWLDDHPDLGGAVFSGEVGSILRHNPDSIVGIDVAYFSTAVLERQSDETTMIDGPPILAVEILSPSDKQKDINGKIDEYRDANVPMIWIVDPHFRTVTIHSNESSPQLFSADQQLSADPVLPGFVVNVRDFFE